MKIKEGTKALVTTDNWFVAPDGRQYKSVFGTVHGVFGDAENLGIKTNARSTNWYVKIGSMIVAGCQIHYAIECESCNFGHAKDWNGGGGQYIEYERMSSIYNADQ